MIIWFYLTCFIIWPFLLVFSSMLLLQLTHNKNGTKFIFWNFLGFSKLIITLKLYINHSSSINFLVYYKAPKRFYCIMWYCLKIKKKKEKFIISWNFCNLKKKILTLVFMKFNLWKNVYLIKTLWVKTGLVNIIKWISIFSLFQILF